MDILKNTPNKSSIFNVENGTRPRIRQEEKSKIIRIRIEMPL